MSVNREKSVEIIMKRRSASENAERVREENDEREIKIINEKMMIISSAFGERKIRESEKMMSGREGK